MKFVILLLLLITNIINAPHHSVYILPWTNSGPYKNRPCVLLKLSIKNRRSQWTVPTIKCNSIASNTEIIKQFEQETGGQLSTSVLSPLFQKNNAQKLYALQIEYKKPPVMHGAIDWAWSYIDSLLQYTNQIRYTLSDISGKNMLDALEIDPLLIRHFQEPVLQTYFQQLGTPILLPKVIIVNNQTLSAKGYFTPNSLKKFLVDTYHKGFTHNLDFANDNPMHIYQPIGLKHGGTDQTFIVEIHGKPKYFIRKIASFTEAVRLTYSLTINEINPFKQKNKSFPVLCLPDYLFTYFYKDSYHSLAIIPYAPGYTLGQLVDQYRSLKINDNTIANAFKQVGKALAHFHNYFMDESCKTIVHGDCNLDNIIINNDNIVYFIDLETLIRSYFVRKPAHEDIVNLISLAIHYYLRTPDENGTLPLKLLSLICTNIFHSYISSLKLDKQKIIWDKTIDYIRNTNNFPHHKPTLLQAISDIERSLF